VDEEVHATATWPDQIFGHLKRARVHQVGYVPDAGHSRLIRRCIEDVEIEDVVLTSEEEGVGLACGAALAGQRTVLLMQSSGVGNCINTFSLLKNCGFSCLVLVTMRGEFAEFNPWQVPMASITEECLRLCGFVVARIENEEDVDQVVGAACDMAFDGQTPVAVLLSQRLIGRKSWNKREGDRD
jgi:sulfopyruvate decarboxylase alpha subunit